MQIVPPDHWHAQYWLYITWKGLLLLECAYYSPALYRAQTGGKDIKYELFFLVVLFGLYLGIYPLDHFLEIIISYCPNKHLSIGMNNDITAKFHYHYHLLFVICILHFIMKCNFK